MEILSINKRDFLETIKQSKGKYNKFTLFSYSNEKWKRDNCIYLTIWEDNYLIWISRLHLNDEKYTYNWNLWDISLDFLTISNKNQGKGYWKKLFDEVFKFAKNNWQNELYATHFTDMWNVGLKPFVSILEEKYWIKYIEKK